MDLNRDYKHDVDTRLGFAIWIIAFFLIIVAARLFYLQIIKGEYYKLFSEKNSVRRISIPAPRGMIFDRDGKVIVDNRPSFNVVVVPQYISNLNELKNTMASLFPNDEKLDEKLTKASKSPAYRPVLINSDVSLDIVSKIKARQSPIDNDSKFNFDGVEIEHSFIRDYAAGRVAPHAIGYVNEVDEKRLENLKEKHPGLYSRGDYAGSSGIEKEWDVLVRGEKGVKEQIVNALGRQILYPDISIELEDKNPTSGGNIYLTLDSDLQRIADKILSGRTGAVVALDPNSGAVLAIHSSPSYDLARLSSKDRSEYWRELVTDEDKPLFNRSIHGLYPPASTYKIISALAGLQENVIDDSGKIDCKGGFKYGNRTFGCWLRSGHGKVNVVDAIAESCDVFFYDVGLKLGVDKLAKYASYLGLGAKTGIEISGEKSGLIPTKRWKLEKRGKKWSKGETLSVAIGQGYNLVTPLQAALAISQVANGGYKIKPHLVDRVVDNDGQSIYRSELEKTSIEGVSKENIDIVKKGLWSVVNGEKGTARGLQYLGLDIAGKTGTAEIVSRKAGTTGKNFKTHAWFVGYAPFDKPEIAVAVIVEYGGHGSSSAAPVAGEIIKEYFKKKESNKVWLKLVGYVKKQSI